MKKIDTGTLDLLMEMITSTLFRRREKPMSSEIELSDVGIVIKYEPHLSWYFTNQVYDIFTRILISDISVSCNFFTQNLIG